MISQKCYKNDLEMFLKTYITATFFCAYLRFVIYCSMTSYKKHASSDRYIYFSVYQNDITTRKGCSHEFGSYHQRQCIIILIYQRNFQTINTASGSD